MARIPSSSSKSKSKFNNENDNNNNHHHQDYQEKELVQPKQQQQLPTKNDRHRRYRLDVAIVGAPNAGKSQLLNVLTKTPISAVSRKRHTTRSDVLGARTIIEDDGDGDDDNNHDKNDDNDIDSNSTNTSASSKATQIIFKDTPGFLRLENAKSERLDRDLIVTAAAELQTVDYSLLVVDAARKLTPTYTSALTELMKGALNSRGRIEIVHDDDYDDDDFDIETLKNNEKDSMNKNKTKNNQSLQLRPKFAIVLNKVDLVKNKNSLIEMAMEIGSIADKLLHEKYGDVVGGGGTVVSNKSSSSSDDDEVDVDVDLDIMIMEVAPIVFYVSALKEPEECEIDLIQHLLELATPSKEWILDNPQETTTLTPIEQIEEVIREKLYRCLHRELPHSIRQINRMFHKIPSTTSSSSSQKLSSGTGGGSVGGLIIQQDLIVFTKSHKKLVLGKGGRTLQRIQDTATKDLIKIFNCEISLRLNVKLGKSKNIRNSDQYDY